MAHYAITTATPLAIKLRNSLNSLQGAIHDLLDTAAALTQMTATEATAVYGFSDGVVTANDTIAAAAMAELQADIAFLGTGQASGAALAQMLNEFAG